MGWIGIGAENLPREDLYLTPYISYFDKKKLSMGSSGVLNHAVHVLARLEQWFWRYGLGHFLRDHFFFFPPHGLHIYFPIYGKAPASMGGATPRALCAACPHWDEPVGAKLCYCPPLNFGEGAVNDINRKSCPHWRKAVGRSCLLLLLGYR